MEDGRISRSASENKVWAAMSVVGKEYPTNVTLRAFTSFSYAWVQTKRKIG